MKIQHILTTFFFLTLIFSCQKKTETLDPKVDANKLETNFREWWTYYNKNISLTSNFVAIDSMSEKVEKADFLMALSSGNYIPLKVKSKDKSDLYKLYELNLQASKDIIQTIKNESLTALNHFKLESMTFPEFDFIDLNGNHYTNENTKGKTLVFKTWFIGCTACIAEFPELNELVEKHKTRNDILFLSLATDSKPDLEKFLKKRLFKYEVIPYQKELIEETLNLQAYPTHIIVGENGNIKKVVNKSSEMISYLEGI